jgi:hypothetical protein
MVLTTEELRFNMLSKVDAGSTWIRCYNMVAQGNAVATFRNNCNDKGMCLI